MGDLSQLHTDYYNKVGHKYGLAIGFSYDELSEEEKRGRKHKKKVVLEAERQAKVALDKVEKYAVLATIDKKELTIPLLNIKAPVQEAMNAVKKELAIPIPTLIGQKAWCEERVSNIYAAIKALVAAINAERDKQNEDVRKSVNKTYTYYMQNLNKQIEENKLLRAENDALKMKTTKSNNASLNLTRRLWSEWLLNFSVLRKNSPVPKVIIPHLWKCTMI